MIHGADKLNFTLAGLFPFIYTTHNLSIFTEVKDGSQIVVDSITPDKPKFYKIREVKGESEKPEAERLYELWDQGEYKLNSEPITQDALGGFMRALTEPQRFASGDTGWSIVNGLTAKDGQLRNYTGTEPAQVRNILTGETLQTQKPDDA